MEPGGAEGEWMISIRQSLEELDQQEKRQQLLRERQRADSERERAILERDARVLNCYAAAIRSIREYTVEVDPALIDKFRSRMAEFEVDLERASRLEHYQALQSSLRGELRQYRDRGQVLVARLRNEVTEAASAMQALTEAVSAHGAGYQAELTQELGKLGAAAALDDPRAVRATVRASTAAIEQSFAQMQRSNETVIARLQEEIRGLHKTMETERRIQGTDPSTGASNRRRVAERIDDLLRRDESFGLLLIAVLNWKRVVQEHSPEAAAASLKALAARLTEKFGAEGLVGRWSDDVLAVIVETDPAIAATMTAGVDAEFSGGAGAGSAASQPQPPAALQIRSALIGRARGSGAADFYPKIGQQVSALTR
jgi:GGDEF domain-containing protein